ncbi:NmrA family NAD(P)-binding protein [Mucisphaera calidilacus]|uniref:NAD(P)H azoreductase n=1 Tax=Mucisphaera calidilacus TaxID=2527982 RepID=A0A518BVV9_9BACT|nr:NmrA family NAD(P)-binding protein [Mucisphaera calidilacus]QDU71116.1 NAD(P)H azoreductase [Mucisphaera calidilacus]
MHPDTILVTGATGNTGREVVRALLANGHPVRAATSNPDRARACLPDTVSVTRLDLMDPQTWDQAICGCSGIFLLRPPAVSNVSHTLNPFIDRAAGIASPHIVFLSVLGAERNAHIPHHKTEKHLMASPCPWTILRPGFFAQNLQDAYLNDIRQDNRLYVPAGSGRVAFIDLHDLGDLTAAIFREPDTHHGCAYSLTGPKAFSFDEVAAILIEELQQTIRYQPAGTLPYLFHLLSRRRQSFLHAVIQTWLHLGLRKGDAEQIDPTLERLLKRPPRNVADYIRDHHKIWLTY